MRVSAGSRLRSRLCELRTFQSIITGVEGRFRATIHVDAARDVLSCSGWRVSLTLARWSRRAGLPLWPLRSPLTAVSNHHYPRLGRALQHHGAECRMISDPQAEPTPAVSAFSEAIVQRHCHVWLIDFTKNPEVARSNARPVNSELSASIEGRHNNHECCQATSHVLRCSYD